MDLFGVKKRKEKYHMQFMNELPSQSDEYLFTAWSSLDMERLLHTHDKYSLIRLRAVEDELTRRGYSDDMGHIIPPK